MAEPAQKRGTLSDKVWDVLMKATVPVSIIVGGALIGHEVRIARIEETRFTDVEGYQLQAQVKDWIEQRFPNRADFRSLQDDVREIKEAVKTMRTDRP